MTSLEVVAVAFGLINVALIVARSVWNYPFGLVMVCLYWVIFRDAKLYSDMVLQAFFFVVQIYGWIAWHAAGNKADHTAPVPVRWLDSQSRWIWGGATLVCWAIWSSAMARFTDASAPWTDGGIAMMSVAAQILMARRMVENWWLWIAVDLVAIPLFASRGLMLTSGLYIVFLLMAFAGLWQWQQAARQEGAGAKR